MLKATDSFDIMIVDDKPANLRLLEKMLAGKGYHVRPFPRGLMALNAAFKDPPDLILLDINMPEMNGFEVCRKLQEDDKTKDLPVIFISALTDTNDKIKALNSGGVDYITKPFQFEEVHARVKTHLKLKNTQKELADKNRFLEKVLSDLKSAQDELIQSKKMAALGVLTSGIAHEINNPVNFIKTSARGLHQDITDFQRLLDISLKYCYKNLKEDDLRLLKSQEEEIDYDLIVEEIPELIKNIHEGVKRTEEIVSSLRLFSRTDNVETQKADIHTLIDASLVILKNRYKPNICIEKKYHPLKNVNVHPGQLIQVMTNIISNAIDAILSKKSFAQEKITIATGKEVKNKKDYILIEISDTGPGIPDELMDRIFDPFFTTKDVGQGVGLGLSISIGIIREHKGTIDVKSSVNSGSTFIIRLPI